MNNGPGAYIRYDLSLLPQAYDRASYSGFAENETADKEQVMGSPNLSGCRTKRRMLSSLLIEVYTYDLMPSISNLFSSNS
jgi:hypothetical protein